MKFIFLGDIEFGRDKDRHCSLFLSKDIIQLLNSNDAIFFNLETVLVSKDFSLKDNYLKHKDIHIYSYGESDLQYIKKHIHKPIFVSTINNHTFDYDVKGYYNTLKLLDTYNYKFTVEKSYYIDSQIIYLNATDHWTIIEYNREKYPENANIWNKHCLLIDNKQKEEYTYKLIQYLNSIKQSRILIFSVHWGRNFQNNNEETTYLSNHITTFFKKLCNLGADIIFGHGAHHINDNYYELYNNKLIIYGLGDFTGDFGYREACYTDKSIGIEYDTESKSVNKILFSGNYKPYDGSSNSNKCKDSYILDELDKPKTDNGGGNIFAREMEMKEIEPYYKKYNIQINKINKELRYNNRQISYKSYFNDKNLKLTSFCHNKSKSNIIYDKYNIPYPKTINAIDYDGNYNELKYPVMLKPIKGAGGHGIISDINNQQQLIDKLNIVDKANYLIQEQIKGKKYRILILNNKIVYIKYDIPPYIIGNGKDTVEELIVILNKKLKAQKKGAYVKNISWKYIQKQGYSKYDIPIKNKKIYITNTINLWNGAQHSNYIPINTVHPDNIELFLKIHNAFKLKFSGIDYITESLEMPYYISNGNVIEINWKPGFSGAIKDYPDRFVQALLDNQYPLL